MNTRYQLHLGDCLEVMRTMESNSVDAVITDPPAGIGFMGQAFDSDRGGRTQWVAWLADRMTQAYRLAKPGSYALVWALPRTSHWSATAVEDGGWVIRDVVTHLFGSGWPKSKACLKPAAEHWILAHKPGPKMVGLQIDACRISGVRSSVYGGASGNGSVYGNRSKVVSDPHPAGRWPANLVLSHSPDCSLLEAIECVDDCPIRILDGQSGPTKSHPHARRNAARPATHEKGSEAAHITSGHSDSGGASRFFYCSKASPKDRGEGNNHPTVKSRALMQWLIRLITPDNGLVLDPFMGSGSTGLAALAEGHRFLGIEQSTDYHAIACRRLEEATTSPTEGDAS